MNIRDTFHQIIFRGCWKLLDSSFSQGLVGVSQHQLTAARSDRSWHVTQRSHRSPRLHFEYHAEYCRMNKLDAIISPQLHQNQMQTATIFLES